MANCHRATVLRAGRVVGTVQVAETSPAAIAQMMVGHDVELIQKSNGRAYGEPRLTVRNLHVNDDRGLAALRGVSFSVHAGEIVGLAGVEGNGQRELVEALIGVRLPEKGDIILDEQTITRARNRQRRSAGLAIIPEDRTHEGLSLPSSLRDNVVSTRYYAEPLSRRHLLLPAQMQRFARRLIQAFDIRVRGPNVAVKTLSGGNAQKVVVARELAETPRVLVAAQPTRGLDIGAMQFVHEELLRLCEQQTAILLISADLDELLALSDRLLVIFEGRLVGEMGANEATRERLGILMAGREPAVEEEVS
jgi:simple sugar transport system ATP-binding protein